MSASSIIIMCLVVSQIVTCCFAYKVYRDLVIDNEDVSERIDFVLEVLDDLKDYLRAQSYESAAKINDMEKQLEESVDLDDPDWWKKG